MIKTSSQQLKINYVQLALVSEQEYIINKTFINNNNRNFIKQNSPDKVMKKNNICNEISVKSTFMELT